MQRGERKGIMDRLQRFKDTRWGFSATLRVDAHLGFWLRVYDPNGKQILKGLYPTAISAKYALERFCVIKPKSAEAEAYARGNWWTVSGCVQDVTN